MTSIAELLGTGEPLVGPGVWDALSARLAVAAGFRTVFVSGYCVSASRLGAPDVGLLTQTEVLAAAAGVCAAVDVPVVVDIDTGYGSELNVERTVRALVRMGAAGCFLEDQVWPKRCGHMDG
jgi:2-methylisocitrate lyase-like PEP mutase family enzyme